MPVRHTISYRCDYCEAERAEVYSGIVLPFSIMYQEAVRYGWTWLGNEIICPNHDIKVVEPGALEPDTEEPDGREGRQGH